MGLRPTEGAKNASDRNHSLWNGCPLLCHPERTRISCLTALTSVTCFSLERNTCSWPKPQLSTGNLWKRRDLRGSADLRGDVF
jgi:hypothetical protein